MNALMPTEKNPFPEYEDGKLSDAERLRRESCKEKKAIGPEFGNTPTGRRRI